MQFFRTPSSVTTVVVQLIVLIMLCRFATAEQMTPTTSSRVARDVTQSRQWRTNDDMRVIGDDLLAALCIYAEARSEPFDGQVAVGNVIRNRTANKHFSDGSVASTILWPYQFSWTNTNDRQRTRVFMVDDAAPAWVEAVAAWNESALRSVVMDAVLYHADYVQPYWARAEQIEFVTRIGRHLFYRRKQNA